jgi:hypothetical protein
VVADDDDIVPKAREMPTQQRIDDGAEPPVVARLVVEIRSDGSRTVARGAMEDATSGESVAIEAHGTTPMSLAFGLARAMMRGRAFARTATRALLPGRKKRNK